jgi:GNAT superfamily N-acetyltransferase
MLLTQPAATLNALIDSLWLDPFYVAISKDFHDDAARRREMLARYFDYSMNEGARKGRLVIWPKPSVGAAVWLLPASKAVSHADSTAKAAFLAESIGKNAAEIYHRIVDFMTPKAMRVVERSAWYLSIVGISPSAQGQGIGARLLEPTLAEADAAGVACYLETFDSRNPRFYQRLGFLSVGTHVEPITQSTYTIMNRPSRLR